ncbi:hypothetical protein GCM10011512_23300 [Tersicoccus solisilvae]|uniref:DUF5129 domain-containing protein n=1 Tax=Tersicoccus solisilvae TaxID=1882339 RepID=A0ABQ1PEJ4_9MICC|nr:DUF5129 domain-containing protein [Tersicoccus solisilvae]GGC95608.1 hypothetical protein GCM10011512_23300 [Tersicoccus solisilvae]
MTDLGRVPTGSAPARPRRRPHRPAGAGGRRLLRAALMLLTLALVAGPTAPGLPSARALASGDLVVEDTAGVLYRPQLERDLRDVDFYQPTRVAVYTVRGTSSGNLNEQTLAFARKQHPEWISDDGQKWADGWFILAVDPQGRHVGTYTGEDRKLSEDEQADVQEATKDLFRQAQWTDGTVAGVVKAAALIERPWYRNPGLIVLGVAAVVVALGALVARAVARAGRRRRFEEALARGNDSYASVTRDLEVTELHANTIPASSRHGSRMLERWSSFLDDYHGLTTVRSRLDGLSPRDRARKEQVSAAQDYERGIVRLDGLDDAIADANALLNHDGGWEAAWQRQSGELLGQLDEAEAMIDTPETAGSEESRGAIRALARRVRADVETWAAGLRDGSLTGDDALDRLAAAQRDLGTRLDVHADAVISDRTRDEKEADLMRSALEDSRRGRGPQRRSSSIVRYSTADLRGFPVWMYVAGLHAGQSSVDHARSSSSSGGSTTGYGASGGSFSGSGSSSSF